MSFVELAVDGLALNPAFVHAIERANKTVSYFVDGLGHDVTYVTDAEAIIAYHAFIALKNAPRPINVGDIVRLRGTFSINIRNAENLRYTVTNIPDLDFPWWSLLGEQTNTTYIVELSSALWLELDP
jgi:hypothetical protein